MDNLDTCPDYKENFINVNGVKRKTCAFYNMKIKGTCLSERHNSCHIYWIKNGISDQLILGLIEDLDLVKTGV